MTPSRTVVRFAPVLALGLAVGLSVEAVRSWRHPASWTFDATPVSAASIGVTEGGWSYAIPTDVVWEDAHNVWHEDGRPDCLPDIGRAVPTPVRIKAVEVKTEGVSWRQVVWVKCLS